MPLFFRTYLESLIVVGVAGGDKGREMDGLGTGVGRGASWSGERSCAVLHVVLPFAYIGCYERGLSPRCCSVSVMMNEQQEMRLTWWVDPLGTAEGNLDAYKLAVTKNGY